MKLSEVPEFQTGGINFLFLKDWAVEDGQFGRQVLMQFSPNIGAEKEKIYKAWIGFSKKFEDKNAGLFTQKLRQLIPVLASFIGLDAAEARYQVVKDKLFAEDLDNNDDDAVKAFHERFLLAMFKAIPANFSTIPIEVVLSYNSAGYLNIPNYKDNGWELPFGLDPHVGVNLLMKKPEVRTLPTETSNTEGGDSQVDTITSGDDGEEW